MVGLPFTRTGGVLTSQYSPPCHWTASSSSALYIYGSIYAIESTYLSIYSQYHHYYINHFHQKPTPIPIGQSQEPGAIHQNITMASLLALLVMVMTSLSTQWSKTYDPPSPHNHRQCLGDIVRCKRCFMAPIREERVSYSSLPQPPPALYHHQEHHHHHRSHIQNPHSP